MSRLNVGSFRHPDGTDDNISLTSTGRVGIGTTSPATPLDVTGSAFAPATFGRNGGTTNTTGSGVIAFSNLGTPGGSSNADMVLRSDYAWAAQINNASSATNALIVDTSNNFKFNSGYGSVATAYGVRAWASWRGDISSGGNSQLNGAGNVSSVTDNGAGDYTINFTNAMPDDQYVVAGNCIEDTTGGRGDNFFTMFRSGRATGSVRVNTVNTAGTPIDNDFVFAAVIR